MSNSTSMSIAKPLTFILLFGCFKTSLSQETIKQEREILQDSIVFQIRTGINIGGFSPLPLPAEIRKIKKFNPKLNFSVEGSATYWFRKSWGIRTGVRLENKAMETDAQVKNYSMEIIGDNGERVAGNWTGGVSTQVINSYITIPISATYALNDKWGFSLGTFWSFLLEKDFSGYVYDGYLREGGATGNKVVFSGENTATYDFSNNLRTFVYGLEVGGNWRASRHLNVFSNLNFELNNIFKSDFKTITFGMRPIYLNIGFGYVF
ncbi:porin family protein [Sphingobacterium paramultivorum]|nr:porin family protein [Sphingobacterium paramultivorum]WSO15967.1 porin family protein [Sphingobacterium paramultivorum]